ncbi:endospore germination permease [Serpentinicella sp. ANB-PHB4]|uniref:GerAB/ArcD/ProY family transporter n=1 Tax=Serpentinicella sp. ANB-PHB4 TaxID=3074076 RepID=UPI00285813ED|nr:endospore germination permease [Serpentinicella sp. ANB-PHB4]MDR5658642.1 endospore germination permease [Serpentinicella sp. ANB-PHB4]
MDRFNTKHFAFLIAATTIVSLKTYPDIYISNGRRDTWVAMIIASFLIFAFTFFAIKVFQKGKEFNFAQVYKEAYGEKLGKFFIGLFIITLLLTLIESASVQSNAMHMNMLVETPPWFFLIFFIFPAIYTIKKDIVAIVSVTLIGITLITIAGINLGILTTGYKDYNLLFPVFEDGVTLGFLLAILKILGLYGSIVIVFPYLTEIKDKGKLLRDTLIGLLFVIQMQIVSATGTLSTFDVSRTYEMAYPKLLQTQLVSYARFVEFGELFVMLQMVGGWYLKYVITFYALLKLWNALGMKDKYLIYIVTLIVFGFSFIISMDINVLFIFLNYYAYISFMNFFVIPLVGFILYALKIKRKTSSSY